MSPCFSYIISLVCTVDLGPIDRNVYNVGALIDDDYISISTYILNGEGTYKHSTLYSVYSIIMI